MRSNSPTLHHSTSPNSMIAAPTAMHPAMVQRNTSARGLDRSAVSRALVLAGALLMTAMTGACDKGNTQPPGGGVACTEEAKICPDGSSVGRQGPKCEFAPCPGEGGEGDGVACTMDAKVCPDGSAVGRQGPKCEFAPCPGE